MIDPMAPRDSSRTASAVLAGLGERQLRGSGVLRTGFEPLDTALGGGLRTRELTVVGGVPGVGKTAMTLQWARNLAASGDTVIYACYEHDQEDLLARLLLLEVGELVEGSFSSSLSTRDAIRAVSGGRRRLSDEVAGNLLLRAARSRVDDYGERLHLVHATIAATDLEVLNSLVATTDAASTLFVDYLQKVPHAGRDDEERAVGVASGLKDLALSHGVGVIATVAGDRSVLEVRRARLHHLRGASGIGYEADVVVMLERQVPGRIQTPQHARPGASGELQAGDCRLGGQEPAGPSPHRRGIRQGLRPLPPRSRGAPRRGASDRRAPLPGVGTQ